MMKRYGESGSPWRRPRLHLNQRPGILFKRIEVRPVERSELIQRRQRSSKPRIWRILSGLSQQIESKAFWKSILRTMVGDLRRWQQLRSSAAYIKFSEMQCPFIKPVWLGPTRRGTKGCSLLVRTFAKDFTRVVWSEIGQKFAAEQAPSFLGRRMFDDYLC